jgi:hypothetical protein
MVKRRPSERGAALFVVVLVVSLLTAIGVFAMHATSLAQLGSGYSRRQATAFYLAELAANLRLASIADDVDKYIGRGMGKNQQRDTCYAAKELLTLSPADDPPFCVAWSTSLAANDAKASISSLSSDPEGFFGALNRPDSPPDQGVTGSIRVESTDHVISAQITGGYGQGTTTTWQDTLTVTGALQPVGAVSDMCTAPVTRASETERLRGIVTYVQLSPPGQ